jgi:hypothetical protein
MGNAQSSVAQQEIENVTKAINDFSLQIKEESKEKCSNTQVISVSFCDNFRIKNNNNRQGIVEFLQNNTQRCTLEANEINNIINDNKAKIIDQLNQLVDQSANSKQGFLALAANVQTEISKNKGKIVQEIKDKISENLTSQCAAYANNAQQGEYKFCGFFEDTDIIVKQNNTQKVVASCIADSVIKALSEYYADSKILQEADQKLVSQQEGITGLFKWIAIIAAALVGGIIVIAIVGYFLKKKSAAQTTATTEEKKEEEKKEEKESEEKKKR